MNCFCTNTNYVREKLLTEIEIAQIDITFRTTGHKYGKRQKPRERESSGETETECNRTNGQQKDKQ